MFFFFSIVYTLTLVLEATGAFFCSNGAMEAIIARGVRGGGG